MKNILNVKSDDLIFWANFKIHAGTAVAKNIHISITEALLKRDHFDRAQPILKILQILSIDTSYVKEV